MDIMNRCPFCGAGSEYACKPWCDGGYVEPECDSDEHRNGEDAQRLDGEVMPARAEGIAQEPTA